MPDRPRVFLGFLVGVLLSLLVLAIVQIDIYLAPKAEKVEQK